jgi:hypothetical protein
MPNSPTRALLSRDIAGAMLDQYFNMVEQILEDSAMERCKMEDQRRLFR